MTILETDITQVTVYLDRARVLRQGRIDLQQGSQRLEITELPPGIDPDSLRAGCRGQPGARLLGVALDREFYAETPREEILALEKEIQALDDQDTALGDRQATLADQLEHLGDLLAQTETMARGLAFGKIAASDHLAFLEETGEHCLQLKDGGQAIAIERRDLEKTRDKLQREFDRLRSVRPKERLVASIDLEIAQEGTHEVDLYYTVNNASWEPIYDLRLEETDVTKPAEALNIDYMAQVRQLTGESWQGVELILSTARPAAGGAVPELEPWYLDVFRPAPTPAPAPRAGRAKAAFSSGDMDDAWVGAEPAALAEPQMAPAEVAVAMVSSDGPAVAFHIPSRPNIPSDGEPHKVTVASLSLVPDLDYVTAPRQGDDVLRRATVANDTQLQFLPGQGNVFVGDTFIGRTEIERVAPSETFELALGVDDRVKVTRDLVRRDVDKTFVGDKRRMLFAYRIQVECHLASPQSIVVLDQFPLSRHEQIKVRLDSISPDPNPSDDSGMNILEWGLTVAPGERQIIDYAFLIEYPRSLHITGLPE